MCLAVDAEFALLSSILSPVTHSRACNDRMRGGMSDADPSAKSFQHAAFPMRTEDRGHRYQGAVPGEASTTMPSLALRRTASSVLGEVEQTPSSK